jgi:hypothetical protein
VSSDGVENSDEDLNLWSTSYFARLHHLGIIANGQGFDESEHLDLFRSSHPFLLEFPSFLLSGSSLPSLKSILCFG